MLTCPWGGIAVFGQVNCTNAKGRIKARVSISRRWVGALLLCVGVDGTAQSRSARHRPAGRTGQDEDAKIPIDHALGYRAGINADSRLAGSLVPSGPSA